MLNLRVSRLFLSALIVPALLAASNMCGLTNAFGAVPDAHDCCKNEPVQKKICCTELLSGQAIETRVELPDAAAGAILVVSVPRSHCGMPKSGDLSEGPPDKGDVPASQLDDFTERTLHSPPVLS